MKPNGPVPSPRGRFIRPGVLSFVLHGVLILFLIVNVKATLFPGSHATYRVTLMPLSPPGGGNAPNPPGIPPSPEKTPAPAEAVPSNSAQGPKAKNTTEAVKEDSKKAEKKGRVTKDEVPEGVRKTDKAKKVAQAKDADKSLQEAIEKISKKVAGRSADEKQTTEGLSSGGRGGEGQTIDTIRGVYGGLVTAKVQQEWALFSKTKTDLEAIVVVVIDRTGKVQKSWFEKKSGNLLYDQMAMRAISKAEPFPPLPKELGGDTIEIGIRFHPK